MVELGAKAPDFTLVDTTRTPKSLSDFAGRKTVIVFYPGAFTGVCTNEMCAFRDALADLNDLDAHVVGISVDSPFANGEFAAKNNISYPLLSDYTRAVTDAFGISFSNFAGLEGYRVPQRSVFILDKDGIVRFKWVAENPGIEPDYAAVIEEVKKI